MRYVVYALLTLAGLVAAAGAFLFFAFPTDYVRDELAARLLERTGRTLTVAQSPSIAFYPEPSIKLHGVTVSPPPGMAGEPSLSIDTLTLKAPVWPLFWHQMTIESFELDHPRIVLRTAANGARSWDLRKETAGETNLRGSASNSAGGPSAPSGSPAAAASPRTIGGLKDLHLHNVHIDSGSIRLVDDRTGLDETLSNVSLRLDLDGIDSAARIDGALTWVGEETTFKGTAGPAANLVSGDPVKLDLTLGGKLATVKLAATYSARESTPLGGRIETSTPSLRDLLSWLRRPLPAGAGFGPFQLTANFGLSSDGFATKEATLTLDGISGKGDFSMTRGKDKPALRANLSLDRLNLNTYIGDGGKFPVPATASTGKDPGKPVVTNAATADGWSDAPIDLTALRSFDADVNITAGSLQWHALKSGHATLRTVLKDGIAKTRLTELELYGGKGSGSISLDGREPETKIATNFSLHGIDVQPFLADAVGIGKLTGRGDLTFALAGNGRSQHDIVKVLQGQGRIELGEGGITGFDLSASLRALQSGQLKSPQAQPTAQTGFSSLTASCTVTNGIMDNRDLVIASPLGQATGAGTLNLPVKTIDYTVQSSLADDGGGSASAAITVPLHISGPLAKPAVTLDLKAIAKNPQAAVNAVTKAVEKFANTKQGKAIGDLLGGLLGKVQKPTDPAAEQPPAQ